MVTNPEDAPAGALSGLRSFAEFQPDVREIFPSLSSLLWFWRVHKSELIEAGAVLKINGRILVDPGRFSLTARAIGARLVMMSVA